MKFTTLEWIAYILVIVGGLNWGLVALNWNLVEFVCGQESTLSRVVYGLVGLAAIYEIFAMRRMMKKAIL